MDMKKNRLITPILFFSLVAVSPELVSAVGHDHSESSFPTKDTCIVRLQKVLENGQQKWGKDVDSIDSIIRELKGMNETSCSSVSKAMIQAYLAEYILTRYQLGITAFDERTPILDGEPESMDDWTTNIFYNHILNALKASVEPATELEAVTLPASSPWLTKSGDNPEPTTLYTVLAQQALALLQNMDLNRSYQFYSGNLPTPQLLFQPLKSFISEPVPDNLNPLVSQQLAVYRQLILFASDKADLSNMVRYNLDRLNFVRRLVPYEEGRRLYVQALEQMLETYADSPAVTLVGAALINERYETDRMEQDLLLARKLIKAFPTGAGSCELKQLAASLEAMVMDLQIPQWVYPGDSVPLSCNLQHVSSFEVTVRNNETGAVWQTTYRPELGATKQKELSLKLPPNTYGTYTVSVVNPQYPDRKAELSYTVTSLFPVYQSAGKEIVLLVVDGQSGVPRPNVKVDVSCETYQKKLLSKQELVTDKSGVIRLVRENGSNTYRFNLTDGKDRYVKDNTFYSYGQEFRTQHSRTQLNFFIDRGVYRPGQSVQFKGILWSGSSSDSRIVAGEEVEVTLYNAQGEQVTSRQLKTDGFGALSGTFTLPDTGLDGTYQLGSKFGRISFEVAQYKRPAFQVNFQNPDSLYAAGDTVLLKGRAVTFAEAPVQEARVSYRVVFENYLWRYPVRERELYNGEVRTNSEGYFSIPVITDIPADQQTKNGVFRIETRVSGMNGETEIADYRLPVGSQPVQIDFDFTNPLPRINSSDNRNMELINTDSLLQLNIRARSMNGNDLAQRGVLSLYRITRDTLPVFQKVVESNTPIPLEFKKTPAGRYLFKVALAGEEGKDSTFYSNEYLLFSPQDQQPPINIPNWYVPLKTEVENGEEARILLGSSLGDISVLYQLFDGEELVETKRLPLSGKNRILEIPYEPRYGNNLTVLYTFVKDQQLFTNQAILTRKEPSRNLTIRTDVFRDHLLPGQEETWKFTVLLPDGKPADAQVLAELYDSRLDKLVPYEWYFNPVYRNYTYVNPWIYPLNVYSSNRISFREMIECPVYETSVMAYKLPLPFRPTTRLGFSGGIKQQALNLSANKETVVQMDASPAMSPQEENSNERYRTDLSETAFFYPNLQTTSDGEVSVKFEVPQNLTTWNLRMLATTSTLKWGMITKQMITSKPFMVQANPPRFVRQGDSLSLPVTLINRTDSMCSGTLSVEVFNPTTDEVITRFEKSFILDPENNASFGFSFHIPADIPLAGMRVRAANTGFSDGEQHLLPILPSRMLVTKSFPITISGNEKQTFPYTEFMEKESTTDNYRYEVQYTGNPVWYAVQALPALSRTPADNASGAITAYYVNTLAAHLASSDPMIDKAIRNWQLIPDKVSQSPLAKNQEVKQILLAETPWVLDAETENANIRSLARLFDKNELSGKQQSALRTLEGLQLADGGFAWFKGMNSSLEQTLHVLDYFARLTALNAIEYGETEREMQQRALRFCDLEISRLYKEKQLGDKTGWFWAYIRSAYRDIPFNDGSLEVHKSIINEMRKEAANANLYQQALASLTLRRYGFVTEADSLNKSLRDLATVSEKLGMYWANNRSSLTSGGSVLETHVLLMQALYEGKASKSEMDAMKLWLLCQKQANSWGGYPVTVDAINALLTTGNDWVGAAKQPVVWVGTYTLSSDPFFNFTDTLFTASSIQPDLGEITIDQQGMNPGFGAAYWQYYADFDAVGQDNGALSVRKAYYKEQTQNGKVYLLPLDSAVDQYDVIVTRLTVRADRDFGFVTLKDQRAACLEPADQVSGYRYTPAVSYYQETEDASTNFFFTNLPKGTYVLEYRSNAVQKGMFNDGVSTIQSLYAPEFTGNAAAGKMIVE